MFNFPQGVIWGFVSWSRIVHYSGSTLKAFGVEAFTITKCDYSSLEHLHWCLACHSGQQN
jgi:hypothetical protein